MSECVYVTVTVHQVVCCRRRWPGSEDWLCAQVSTAGWGDSLTVGVLLNGNMLITSLGTRYSDCVLRVIATDGCERQCYYRQWSVIVCCRVIMSRRDWFNSSSLCQASRSPTSLDRYVLCSLLLYPLHVHTFLSITAICSCLMPFTKSLTFWTCRCSRYNGAIGGCFQVGLD